MRNNMTKFALKLSRDQIQLLVSDEKNAYLEIGSADPNDQNISDNLQILRDQVNALVGGNPLVDVMLPEELILTQNLSIDSIDTPVSMVQAAKLIATACDLKQDEINIALGTPTSHHLQPVAAVTTKTINETRYFLNNAGFKTNRFTASGNLSGFAKVPVFHKDKAEKEMPLLSTKTAVVSGIATFTFILFFIALLFAVKPLQQLTPSNQINQSISAALLTDLSLDRETSMERPIFSLGTNSIPNITNQKRDYISTLLNKNLQPSPTIIKNTSTKSTVYLKIPQILNNKQQVLFSANPTAPKKNSSISKELDNLDLNPSHGHFSNIQHSLSQNKILKLQQLKSNVQTDYQKLIEPILNQIDELTRINNHGEISTPIEQSDKSFLIPKTFPQPRFISLASIDHRYLKRQSFNPYELKQTIKSNFVNYSTISKQSPMNLRNTDYFIDQIILSNNQDKLNSRRFNNFNFTPEEILKSRIFMPLERPNLIAEINILTEPTLSSGAVTLSNEPLIRPQLVMLLPRVNPDKVNILAKATKRPSFPRRASVKNNATISNIIELNRTNLIGVFGTKRNAIALLRLASGRVIKVKVGDRFDGWKVLTIHEDKIELANGKKQETLRLPG